MSDERIVISVEDRVAASVPTKFRKIATAADDAAASVTIMKRAMRGIVAPVGLTAFVGYLAQLNTQLAGLSGASSSAALAITRIQAAMNATALSAARLATEQQRTAIAAQRLVVAQNAAAASAQSLSAAQYRAAAAASAAATAAAKATIAQANAANAAALSAAKLATAQAGVVSAQNAAALSTLRLAQAQRTATASSNVLAGSTSRLLGVTSLLGSAFSVVGVVMLADAYTGLNNRIKMVTNSSGAQIEAMNRVKEIALNTYGNVTSLTTLFARIDRPMRNLGRSQEDTLKLTETISKAIAVGGLSAQEASSSMLQLSQAFNSGRLNGDEFRSVSENMPMFLDAISRSTGRSTLELKKMSENGEITSEVMIAAFEEMARTIDKPFSEVVPRIGMAFNNLKTQAIFFFGELDKSAGITNFFSESLMWMGDNIATVTSYVTAAAIVFAGMYVSSLVAAAFSTGLLSGALLILKKALIGVGIGALIVGIGFLINKFFELSQALGSNGAAFAAMWEIAKEVVDRIVEGFKGMGQIIVGVAGTMVLGFTTMGNQLLRTGAFVIDTLKALSENLKIAVLNTFGFIIAKVQGAFAKMINVVIDNINGLANAVNSVLGDVISTIDRLDESGGDAFSPQSFVDLPAWSNATGGLENMVESMADTVGSNFEEGASRIAAAATSELTSIGKLNDAIAEHQKIVEAAAEAPSELRGADPEQAARLAAEKAAIDAANDAKKKGSETRKTEKATLEKILIDLDNEFNVLQEMSKEREVSRTMMGHLNDLRKDGVLLSLEEINMLREKVELLQKETEMAQLRDQIMGDTIYKRQQELDQIRAISQLQQMNPEFSQGDSATAVMNSGVGEFLAGTSVDTDARIAQMESYYAQLDLLRQENLISEQAANAASTAIWAEQQKLKTQQYSDFFGTMAGLASSGNEKLAKIGKAAAIAQAVINTYQSATAAYASMAAIPVVGPALGAAAAAAAVTVGLANVAQIRSQPTAAGFRDGGYTGNMGVNDVAGVVHGKEYVMTAATTSRIGVANLESLQRGTARVETPSQTSYDGSNSSNPDNSGTTSEPVFNFFVVGSEAEAKDLAATLPGNSQFVDLVAKNKKSIKKVLES
jgi:tape measure domain-containing protein